MSKTVLVIAAFAIAVISAFIGSRFYQFRANGPEQTQIASVATAKSYQDFVGIIRPPFKLPDISQTTRDVAEWDGNILVINFWATWCPPCREEIPEFIELQDHYTGSGVQFIGIALQKTEDVTEFAKELGINYPILTGEQDVIVVAQAYGNLYGALPYTVIIDRQSRIAFIKQGPLARDDAEQEIIALLAKGG